MTLNAETPPFLAEPGYQRLLDILRRMDSIAVACSGGLDSSLLLVVAHHIRQTGAGGGGGVNIDNGYGGVNIDNGYGAACLASMINQL